MHFEPTPIKGAFTIHLSPFTDDRGAFARLYCEKDFGIIGHTRPIVQINHSLTREKGTVRGIHFQYPPDAEIKIIRCLRGMVFDVLVDLRTDSPTFLKWHAVELSPDSFNMVYIPEGCAHGFQTLEKDSELLYLHTAMYTKGSEGGIRYDDPKISIDWPLSAVNVSGRDKSYPLLNDSFTGIMAFYS